MKEIAQLDLYPYTGWHIQANYHHQGDLYREKQPYHDYDIKSGDLGFFDFKLQDSYPKNPNEFRIILIGGSGAQGWGAQTNAHMMYRLLPAAINQQMERCDIEVTLVNMAMGSMHSYQNYVALNRWAHPLKPDLILSYSGRNDVWVPFSVQSDSVWFFPALDALSIAVYPQEGNAWIRWLDDAFPNLIGGTGIGIGLRLGTDYQGYIERAVDRYSKRTGTAFNGDAKDFLERVVKRQYRSAMESIKRDFDGIPIAIAWQAVLPREWEEQEEIRSLGPDFYRNWFAELPGQLQHYKNDQWYFINADAYMNTLPESVNTGTHQGNEGQKMLSEYLAQELVPVIRQLRHCPVS